MKQAAITFITALCFFAQNAHAAKCNPGYYWYSSFWWGSCVACPVGYYCNNDSRYPCTPGSYQDATGQSSCKSCRPGTYSSSYARTSCSSCTPGTYQNLFRQTSCKSCLLGMYQDFYGQPSCKSCPPQTYADTLRSTSCKSCAEGTGFVSSVEPCVPTAKPTLAPTPFHNLVAAGAECKGCRKDLFAGRYVYCDGTYAGSTVTHCDWTGGSGQGCTFPAEKTVSKDECRAKCQADPNCYFYASYDGDICNLFMMTSCQTTSWVGDVFVAPPPTPAPTLSPTKKPTKSPTPPTPLPTRVPTKSPVVQHTLIGTGVECRGCRKDLFAGRYVYCDGTYPGSTVTHCDWTGGSGEGCTFPAEKTVSKDQCKAKCKADPNCYFYASYDGDICNLFMMTSCQTTSWVSSGTLYSL